MGKRSAQRKSAVMLDSDDDASSVSSSSTIRSDRMSNMGAEEADFQKDALLDQALDALYEKRGSTRERALATMIDAFKSDMQYEFVENKFATMLHQCLNSIKRGSAKEICLASHAIGLLALTVGLGDNAHEILEESVTPLSQALKAGSDSSKVASLLECLAVITFVGGTTPEETERSMQIIWQKIHPKLGSNVAAVKPSTPVITAVVSSWAFLLTTVTEWTLSPDLWQDTVQYLSSLLDKEDRSVRIAAGEALALIFELGTLEKFSAEVKGFPDGSLAEGKVSLERLMRMKGLRAKVINQMWKLSVEAGGKGSAKKDLNSQRNLFKDVLEYLEDGNLPETSTKIGGSTLHTSSWSEMIQLNFLKRFLGGGFIKHMQENEFLYEVFGFTPKKHLSAAEHRMSNGEKRMFRSPNSALSKARTRFLNKQRRMSERKNVGRYAVHVDEEEEA